MPVSLDQILASTRGFLPALRLRERALEREAGAAPPPPSLAAALRGEGVAVIAEVKRQSPSAGVIRGDLDPGERAAAYARAGAAAISVLTDGPFFGGSIADLRVAVSRVRVPVLRKDFILDELQIVEARAAGAAAVLLIVRALEPERLKALIRFAATQGLDAVVEVHADDELARALESGARIIGVNSRDLDTFRIDIPAALGLLARVPADHVAIAESGMKSVADVARAADAGADAVLIGTALSAADAPETLVARVAKVRRRGR
jgi:indole-3-glycerol phosphate synthase